MTTVEWVILIMILSYGAGALCMWFYCDIHYNGGEHNRRAGDPK